MAKQLGDKTFALEVYKQAETTLSSYDEYAKLAEAVFQDTGDSAYAGEIYKKAAAASSDTTQLVTVATALLEKVDDKPGALEVLKDAESSVETLDDFKKVSEAIMKYAEDSEWINNIELQLKKREDFKDLYEEFVRREKECLTSTSMMNLAHEV